MIFFFFKALLWDAFLLELMIRNSRAALPQFLVTGCLFRIRGRRRRWQNVKQFSAWKVKQRLFSIATGSHVCKRIFCSAVPVATVVPLVPWGGGGLFYKLFWTAAYLLLLHFMELGAKNSSEFKVSFFKRDRERCINFLILCHFRFCSFESAPNPRLFWFNCASFHRIKTKSLVCKWWFLPPPKIRLWFSSPAC